MVNKREYEAKTISLNGDRMLISTCKKAGLYLYNPKGEFNGYGYEKLPMAIEIRSLGEMRKFNKLKREVEERRGNEPKKNQNQWWKNT